MFSNQNSRLKRVVECGHHKVAEKEKFPNQFLHQFLPDILKLYSCETLQCYTIRVILNPNLCIIGPCKGLQLMSDIIPIIIPT